jgi:trehalose/maltose hydrolase-like predicted phosphorylase
MSDILFLPTVEKKKMKFVKKLYQIPEWEDYWVSEDGKVFSTKSGEVKELKPGLAGAAGNQRLSVVLYKDGVKKSFRVHRLVATAFHGPCPEGMECCHNDGNRLNNHRDNLRWDTHKNNQADQKLHGTCHSITKKVSGSKHGLSKLTEADVLQIRAAYTAIGISQQTLAKQYGVAQDQISRIVNRLVWTHI